MAPCAGQTLSPDCCQEMISSQTCGAPESIWWIGADVPGDIASSHMAKKAQLLGIWLRALLDAEKRETCACLTVVPPPGLLHRRHQDALKTRGVVLGRLRCMWLRCRSL